MAFTPQAATSSARQQGHEYLYAPRAAPLRPPNAISRVHGLQLPYGYRRTVRSPSTRGPYLSFPPALQHELAPRSGSAKTALITRDWPPTLSAPDAATSAAAMGWPSGMHLPKGGEKGKRKKR